MVMVYWCWRGVGVGVGIAVGVGYGYGVGAMLALLFGAHRSSRATVLLGRLIVLSDKLI